MGSFVHRLTALISAILAFAAFPVYSQAPTIEKRSETQFGNHEGDGRIEKVMVGSGGQSIVVGTARVPDPDRSGKKLTTLTYTVISEDGKVVLERSYGRAPALVALGATHKNGITYIRGYNAPSIFSNRRDVWLAAISSAGELLWRKPSAVAGSGDLELFVEPHGQPVLAGIVSRESGHVGLVPIASDGTMGEIEVFGTIKNEGWTYPQFIVRTHSVDGTELLFARSNTEEVRVDRFVANKSAGWSRAVAWPGGPHSTPTRPESLSLKALSDGSVALVGQSGGVAIDKERKKFNARELCSWILILEGRDQPSLRRIEFQEDVKFVDVKRMAPNELLILANVFGTERGLAREATEKNYPRGVVGVRYVLSTADDLSTIKWRSLYFTRFTGLFGDDLVNSVMVGDYMDINSGNEAGYAYVLVNYLFVGKGPPFSSKLFGVFEDFKHSRRASSGNVILITQGSTNSRLKGPVSRTFRIGSTTGDEK